MFLQSTNPTTVTNNHYFSRHKNEQPLAEPHKRKLSNLTENCTKRQRIYSRNIEERMDCLTFSPNIKELFKQLAHNTKQKSADSEEIAERFGVLIDEFINGTLINRINALHLLNHNLYAQLLNWVAKTPELSKCSLECQTSDQKTDRFTSEYEARKNAAINICEALIGGRTDPEINIDEITDDLPQFIVEQFPDWVAFDDYSGCESCSDSESCSDD